MTDDEFKLTLEEVSHLFYFNKKGKNYDQRYITRGFLEIIRGRRDYENLASEFPFLPPEIVFFLKFSFGLKDGKTIECLYWAERKYKEEISKNKISVDLVRESVVKACIFSLRKGIGFREAFSINVLKPLINNYLRNKKESKVKTTLNQELYLVLNQIGNVGVYAEDLFLRQVTQ